jgi:tripartite-type tricarboxylate transporter receptor subunit TctC
LRFGAELSAFPQGGADDATARTIQDAMQRALGQPIVIENLGGAGGPNRSGT